MANKRYDEFGAGTYDPAKIILQADPSTGALEKIPLAPDYTQFGAGTYDPAKIFLQADASTGALEKVNLPTIPSGAPAPITDVNSANNSGSNPQTMATLTVPANKLNTNGDIMEIYGVLNYLTGSGTKTYLIDFAGQQIITRSNASAAVHTFYATLMRIDSTHYAFSSYEYQGTSIFTTAGPTLVTFNPAISNNVTVKITAGAANDIKYWYSYVRFTLH